MTMQSYTIRPNQKEAIALKADEEDSKNTINTALNMREFMKKNDI